MSMLKVKDLKVNYGGIEALKGISFDVEQGRIVTLIGANGAGKSTTLRAISGLVKTASGAINFLGRDIIPFNAQQVVAEGIALVPEGRRVFDNLTVKENLILAAREGPLDDTRLQWIFGFFPALKRFWLSRAGSLSGGQKQMLSIARAIVEPRKLLLIDEPTKGLAPAIVVNLIECLAEVKKRGATVLLVEQNFRVAQEVGDSVLVMDNGKIVHRGAMAELAKDTSLQEKLLGLSLEAHQ